MTIVITLTVSGSDVGDFDVYGNLDGYTIAIVTGVSRSALITGYSLVVPDGTSTIKLVSTGLCTNFELIPISTTTSTTSTTATPTTSTTSTTSSTTSTSSTTTTTTAPITYYEHRRSLIPSATECSICPPIYGSGKFYTVLSDNIPTIGMTLYDSALLDDGFNGNNMWWNIDWDGFSPSSINMVKILNSGVVIDTGQCSVDCPTTTTTTTTI